MGISSYIKEIWRGKDLHRIFMNEECRNYTMKDKVLDIGSGLKLASYYRFLQRESSALIECLDLGFESDAGGKKINLEKDFLPHQTESINTVLLFNVLEHLYNFSLILSEIKRVLKNGGQMIGSVPSLVGHHADPHDYWRFTSESLERIFLQHGFSNIKIKIIGKGPITAAFSQIEFILPRLVKMLVVPVFFLFDKLLFFFKPKLHREKFALGLFFSLKK